MTVIYRQESKILAVLNDIDNDYSVLEKINVAVRVCLRNSSVCKTQEDNSERLEVHSCLRGFVLDLLSPSRKYIFKNKVKSDEIIAGSGFHELTAMETLRFLAQSLFKRLFFNIPRISQANNINEPGN